MIQFKVKFNTLNDIAEFCNEIEKLDCEADLSNKRYLIPAQSIMSIVGMNPMDEMYLIIYSNDKDIKNIFSKWRVV